jgi:hypothetical protein
MGDAKISYMKKTSHRGRPKKSTNTKRACAEHALAEAVDPQSRMPDFLARLKANYGERVLAVSGAEIVATDRNRY